jgi:hypothetical protein
MSSNVVLFSVCMSEPVVVAIRHGQTYVFVCPNQTLDAAIDGVADALTVVGIWFERQRISTWLTEHLSNADTTKLLA